MQYVTNRVRNYYKFYLINVTNVTFVTFIFENLFFCTFLLQIHRKKIFMQFI